MIRNSGSDTRTTDGEGCRTRSQERGRSKRERDDREGVDRDPSTHRGCEAKVEGAKDCDTQDGGYAGCHSWHLMAAAAT